MPKWILKDAYLGTTDHLEMGQVIATLEDGTFSCLTCGKSGFRYKSSAKRHFHEIHSSMLHQSEEICPYCCKAYKTKRHLVSHLRTSHGVRGLQQTNLASNWVMLKTRLSIGVPNHMQWPPLIQRSPLQWLQICAQWYLEVASRNVWSAMLRRPGTKCRGI